jgi:competence protein ComEC
MKSKVRIIGLALLGVLAGFAWWRSAPGNLLVRWTMVHVNQAAQGDAHLIEFTHGPTILIDAGLASQAEGLLSLLQRRGVRRLDSVWISHAHRDHYGGLFSLIDAGIQIGEVRMNLPDRSLCQSEEPWGCDWSEIEKLSRTLQNAAIPIRTVKQGERLEGGEAGSLSVLYAYDGVNTPVGRTDINDTSLVVLLTAGKTRALFTGDLNSLIGEYLAREGKGLEADILKIPHHGTDSVAPNAFFDRVSSKVALVPSPGGLWKSERSSRVRSYLLSSGQRVYVNGFNGNVEVLINKQGYRVVPQYR